MRKVLAVLVLVGVVAGGAAWYTLSHLPAQIRAEIDAVVGAMAPRHVFTYDSVDLSVFDGKAVFSDVAVHDTVKQFTVTAKSLTASTADGDQTYDVVLDGASVIYNDKGPRKLLAETVRIDGVSVRAAAEKTPTDPLAELKRLNIKRMSIRGITDDRNELSIDDISLSDLADASFRNAKISNITLKTEGEPFTLAVAGIAAADIDIGQIVTLPTTFRGQPDWKKLDLGKISVSDLSADGPEFKFRLKEILSDGVKAGRVVRFRIGGMSLNGAIKKTQKPYEFSLGKLEMNNFPIITDFPKSASEIQAFQARHKNLIYDGFDLRDAVLKVDGGVFELRRATVPKPDFRKTPSGAEYAAKAEMKMDLRADISKFTTDGKPLDPALGKIFKDLRIQVEFSGNSTADHLKKTQQIDRLTISAPNVARLNMSASVGNLPLRYFEAPNDPVVQQIAIRQATIGGLEFTLVDDGVAAKLIDMGAENARQTRQQFIRATSLTMRTLITRDGSPESAEIAKALDAFLADPKSLTLKMDPTRSVPVMALANPQLLQSVGNVSKVLGLKLLVNQPAVK